MIDVIVLFLLFFKVCLECIRKNDLVRIVVVLILIFIDWDIEVMIFLNGFIFFFLRRVVSVVWIFEVFENDWKGLKLSLVIKLLFCYCIIFNVGSL